MTRPTSLTWIQTTGGPPILMPARALAAWHGIGNDWVPADERAAGAAPADYDRACEVEGYSSLIDVGIDSAYVLGDEPLPVCWIAGAPGEGTLVQPRGSRGDTQLLDDLDASPLDERALETTSYSSPGTHHILFDSSASGDEAVDEGVRVELAAGEYEIRVVERRTASGLTLVLRELRRTESGTLRSR
jgi:Immunity protein 21